MKKTLNEKKALQEQRIWNNIPNNLSFTSAANSNKFDAKNTISFGQILSKYSQDDYCFVIVSSLHCPACDAAIGDAKRLQKKYNNIKLIVLNKEIEEESEILKMDEKRQSVGGEMYLYQASITPNRIPVVLVYKAGKLVYRETGNPFPYAPADGEIEKVSLTSTTSTLSSRQRRFVRFVQKILPQVGSKFDKNFRKVRQDKSGNVIEEIRYRLVHKEYDTLDYKGPNYTARIYFFNKKALLRTMAYLEQYPKDKELVYFINERDDLYKKLGLRSKFRIKDHWKNFKREDQDVFVEIKELKKRSASDKSYTDKSVPASDKFYTDKSGTLLRSTIPSNHALLKYNYNNQYFQFSSPKYSVLVFMKKSISADNLERLFKSKEFPVIFYFVRKYNLINKELGLKVDYSFNKKVNPNSEGDVVIAVTSK